jgi:hypothetical protein
LAGAAIGGAGEAPQVPIQRAGAAPAPVAALAAKVRALMIVKSRMTLIPPECCGSVPA